MFRVGGRVVKCCVSRVNGRALSLSIGCPGWAGEPLSVVCPGGANPFKWHMCRVVGNPVRVVYPEWVGEASSVVCLEWKEGHSVNKKHKTKAGIMSTTESKRLRRRPAAGWRHVLTMILKIKVNGTFLLSG